MHIVRLYELFALFMPYFIIFRAACIHCTNAPTETVETDAWNGFSVSRSPSHMQHTVYGYTSFQQFTLKFIFFYFTNCYHSLHMINYSIYVMTQERKKMSRKKTRGKKYGARTPSIILVETFQWLIFSRKETIERACEWERERGRDIENGEQTSNNNILLFAFWKGIKRN